jgi:hypothetical protein
MASCRGYGFVLSAIMGILLIFISVRATGAQPASAKHTSRTCVPVADAAKDLNHDVCISAHVYAVVELPDGTRFLDICPADQPDDQCRFTLVSLRADRNDVGDLRKYRDQEVQVRGVVRATHGRMGIVISHVRQFSGGPEKFRPNPKLLRDFNGQSDRMPVRDPNLASSGHSRSFMNTSEKEELPAQKH